MDPFRKNNPLNSQPNLNGSELKRRKDSSNKVAETDENEFPFLHNEVPTKSQNLKTELMKNALFSNTSSFKKKILAERKEENSYLESTPQSKHTLYANPNGASFHNSPISLHSYDPITNYTSPRPKFLRYNPNRRRELLQRIEGEKRGNEDEQLVSSLSSPNSSSKRENDNEHEEEEELEEKPFNSCVVWSLILIFGVLLLIFYCMISGYLSLGGYESPEFNIQKIQSETSLRLERKNLFSKFLLGKFMKMSQICPVVEESLCYLDENLSVSFEIDEIIGRENAGEGESLIEGIRSGLSDNTEVLADEVHYLLLKHGGMVDDGSLDKQNFDHGDQNLRYFGTLAEEGGANKSITSVDSSVVSVVQDVSDSLSTITEDKFHNLSLESIELSTILHSRVEESTPPDDQDLENFNFSSAFDTELKSDYSSSILSKGALLTFAIFLGSLIIVVGLLSSFHKYFPRQRLNSLPSPPPSSEFCLKSETEEKLVTNFPMKEEKAADISVENISSRSNNVSSTMDNLNIELKKASDFGPPTVKLLGEFSLFDVGVTNNGSGSNLKKMEQPNSQFSYYQKGKERKMSSPLPYMLDSSPEESYSSRFSSKVPTDKGDISDTSATSSLRRSSRLRNRNQPHESKHFDVTI